MEKAQIMQQIAAVDWSRYETAYGNAAQDILLCADRR